MTDDRKLRGEDEFAPRFVEHAAKFDTAKADDKQDATDEDEQK